jgi:hypothetical protein
MLTQFKREMTQYCFNISYPSSTQVLRYEVDFSNFNIETIIHLNQVSDISPQHCYICVLGLYILKNYEFLISNVLGML